MRKTPIHLSILTVLLAASLTSMVNNAYAAPSAWSQLTGWFKNKNLQTQEKTSEVPPAPEIKPANIEQSSNVAEANSTTPESQSVPTLNKATDQPKAAAEGPAAVVERATIPENTPIPAAAQPHWGINNLPTVAINQKNYENINLNDYVTSNVNQDNFLYSLTPGKTNPEWISLQANGMLHIFAERINPEDIDTTQVIYVTATSSRSGKSTSAEITIKITANDQLPGPGWQPNFILHDAIPNQSYLVDLATAVNTNNLQDNDQLIFQLVSSSAGWLQIGGNGFSLVARKIPESAAGKYYEVILRVTSKMSGKSNDFNGKIYVNPIPQPLQWQAMPAATLNKNYSLDLAKLVSSNIKNDQFIFHVDIATLPHWLAIQNNRVLNGIPQEAALLDHPQKVDVTVKSLVSGMTRKTILVIPVNPDQQLTPQWKKDFFSNPIIDEPYRSDDLTTVLNNRYPHDALSFEYVDGPKWLGFNSLCHCLASKGDVPNEAAGKSFTLKLRLHSKASGQSRDYEQAVTVYSGVPRWVQNSLPDVKIAQGSPIAIPINNYTQDDISGDKFTYTLDQLHSPRWINLSTKGNQTYLIINTNAISTNEVGTTQSVRVLSTSQATHKTSVQLLTINVRPNSSLPAPAWKNIPLSTATVGVSHAVDLTQYVHKSVTDDRLTITLGSDSPSWLSIKDNRLLGIPSRQQIGGPYPVYLQVYSRAAGTHTVIKTQMSVQLVVVAEDTMEIHQFYDNHVSIVIRGLAKNHKYHLAEVKGSHFDYGPFYSPHAIKSSEDWDGNPFYGVNNDKMIETGDDGVVSIVYYTLAASPAPKFDLIILR